MRKLFIIILLSSCSPAMREQQPIIIDPKVYDTVPVPIPKDIAIINGYYQ